MSSEFENQARLAGSFGFVSILSAVVMMPLVDGWLVTE
jgi:hypothetical protein